MTVSSYYLPENIFKNLGLMNDLNVNLENFQAKAARQRDPRPGGEPLDDDLAQRDIRELELSLVLDPFDTRVVKVNAAAQAAHRELGSVRLPRHRDHLFASLDRPQPPEVHVEQVHVCALFICASENVHRGRPARQPHAMFKLHLSQNRELFSLGGLRSRSGRRHRQRASILGLHDHPHAAAVVLHRAQESLA